MSYLDAETLFSIKLSLQVALISTFFVFLIGSTIAYLLAMKNFKGKIILEVVVTIPLILPPTVVGYYLIMLFGKNGALGHLIYKMTEWTIMFSWWAAVLASFVVSLPLMIKAAQSAIASVDRTMIDTCYMLGYSEFETVLKIILPLAKHGIMTGIVLTFARCLGEFGATLILAGNIPGRTSTMPLSIYSFVSTGEWHKANFLAIILTLTSALFLLSTHHLGKKRG